ncbi:hypothetical protein [Tsukamurella sp. 1534]|uniref:hypothetical protein n=1 Tax=Tsukamurella sp. 1534 TaxID=1151061 RepID=UPI0002E21FBF|nr:hypothetical protein [Tsukamurella sp. 1534]
MTASITDLGARRTVERAERLLAGPRLKVIAGDDTVGDVVPVPAALLAELLDLARPANQIRPALLVHDSGTTIALEVWPTRTEIGRGVYELHAPASSSHALGMWLSRLKPTAHRGSLWIRFDGAARIVDEIRIGSGTHKAPSARIALGPQIPEARA